MEWFILTILFLLIALLAGAISDLIGYLMERIDEDH